jgi:hypothetical protein
MPFIHSYPGELLRPFSRAEARFRPGKTRREQGKTPPARTCRILSREDTHTAERFYPSGHTLPLHHVKEQDDAEAPRLWSRAAFRERRAWWR